MKTIQFTPVAIVTPNAIALPDGAPDIEAVLAAEIERLPTALGVQDHPAANIANAFADHTGILVAASVGNHTQAQVVGAFADHAMADVALGVGDHTMAQIVACIADHPVHSHPILVGIAAVGEAFGASGAGATDISSTTGQTLPAAGAGGGVQNNAAQAHVGSTTDLTHVAGAALAHVADVDITHAGAADLAHVADTAVAHGAAADPVVAAVPTRISTRTFSLDVDTVLGDLVTIDFLEVGEVVRTS